ncbi:MAG: hypothetical protein COA63_002035 [Methylophaga sp.]|nr:hypothetical protein [Methylophaga sp.]
MKYIKYTLWIMLAFLIIFIALEIKKGIEQRNALIKAEKLATYGSQGKPKEYDLKSIALSGSIYDGTAYKIGVGYRAQSDSKLCESWALFQGRSKSSRSYWYEPAIENGQHHITVPLNEHNPNIGCKYKLNYVTLSLDRGEYQLPSSSFMLFYADMDQPLNPAAYGFKYQEIQGEKDIINIECVLPDPNDINYSYSPCGLAPVTNKIAVGQYLKPNISNYELNIHFLSQDEYQNTLNDNISKNQ